MSYTVNILRWAKSDIEEKIGYVRKERGIAIARKVYEELMEKMALLATQPLMGATVPELVDLGRTDFRVLVHETHTKILYHIDDDNKVIDIHMIYGSRQNFQDLLYKRVIRFVQ